MTKQYELWNLKYLCLSLTTRQRLHSYGVDGCAYNYRYPFRNYIYGSQLYFQCSSRKKARAEVISISLALDKFKNEEGDYPEADSSKSIEERGKILFMSLSGWFDIEGNDVPVTERGLSYLPKDSFTLEKIMEILSNRILYREINYSGILEMVLKFF